MHMAAAGAQRSMLTRYGRMQAVLCSQGFCTADTSVLSPWCVPAAYGASAHKRIARHQACRWPTLIDQRPVFASSLSLAHWALDCGKLAVTPSHTSADVYDVRLPASDWLAGRGISACSRSGKAWCTPGTQPKRSRRGSSTRPPSCSGSRSALWRQMRSVVVVPVPELPLQMFTAHDLGSSLPTLHISMLSSLVIMQMQQPAAEHGRIEPPPLRHGVLQEAEERQYRELFQDHHAAFADLMDPDGLPAAAQPEQPKQPPVQHLLRTATLQDIVGCHRAVFCEVRHCCTVSLFHRWCSAQEASAQHLRSKEQVCAGQILMRTSVQGLQLYNSLVCHACIGADSCQACADAEVPYGLQDDSNSAAGSWGPQFLTAHKLGYKLAGGSSCCQAEQADEAAAAGCLMAACLSSLSSTCTFTATAVVPGEQSCNTSCSWSPECAHESGCP